MTTERLRWQIHLPAKLITPISGACCHLSAHIVTKIVKRHNGIVYREINASNICFRKTLRLDSSAIEPVTFSPLLTALLGDSKVGPTSYE
jgi:hypothetical protein